MYILRWGQPDSPLPEGVIYEGVSPEPIKVLSLLPFMSFALITYTSRTTQ